MNALSNVFPFAPAYYQTSFQKQLIAKGVMNPNAKRVKRALNYDKPIRFLKHFNSTDIQNHLYAAGIWGVRPVQRNALFDYLGTLPKNNLNALCHIMRNAK